MQIANCGKLIKTLKINNLRHSYQSSPERKAEFVTNFQILEGKIVKLSVRNSPQQSANAEAFAKASLCFLVSALAKTMLR